MGETTDEKKLTAISGSLAKASVNTAILRTVAERAPAGVEVVVLDISDIPLYNEDFETNPPAPIPMAHS
ncbi:NADPH-dependent FMN reductase [Pseudomonas sp. B21-040]|uniref:NADPH-dependent FMN reductase n=1 Tax=Pseudomonas sp. B21-040 TaxID=2895486 RepID=UPI0038D3E17D